MGVESLNYTGSYLHLTSLRRKSRQHASSFLPPNFLKLVPGGSFVTTVARVQKPQGPESTQLCDMAQMSC